MEKGETEIMVPMTNTLLIRGKMVDAPMMVELGGGILMEKNTEGRDNTRPLLENPGKFLQKIFRHSSFSAHEQILITRKLI